MKIVKFILLFITLPICFNAIAQKQNNQWRFGNGGGIDFNTIPPSNVSGALLSTGEGSASIADRKTGALLFYTNGINVWDANNQIMPNGGGLLGGTPSLLSSTTAAVIIPKPSSNNLYYLVTIDEQSSSNGIRYSIVDMNLNAGLGDIVAGQKNISLFQTTSEKLEVVPASDQKSYWLLTHDNLGNSFYAFKVSESGIQNNPVVSKLGATQGNGAGHMKINRQFNKLAMGELFTSTMELFDFDNATGKVSNVIAWKYNLTSPLIYGVEFSPNGKVLYISNLQTILQYDISQTTSAAIQNSVYQFSTGFAQPASMQLASDDKIYINSGSSIDVINCPNQLGVACGFQQDVIANRTGGGFYGLPKWIYYANDQPNSSSNAISFSDSCVGNNTRFSISDTNNIIGVTWNFGDPNSGANNTAVGFSSSHAFSKIGNYNVRAILSNACGTDTLFLPGLSIIDCKVVNTPSIIGIKLVGDTCTLPASIKFQAEGTSNSPYFFWRFDDKSSGVNDTVTITGLSPSPFPTHLFASAGEYNVCVSFKEPGSTSAQTICRRVQIGQCCKGIIASLDSCLQNGTQFSVSTNNTFSSVAWNFDDPLSGTNNNSSTLAPSHLFSATGSYRIRAIVNFSCGIDTLYKTLSIINCDTNVVACELGVPNVFTPNADGLNDEFYPLANCTYAQYECLIFNRWGERIFSTTNPLDKWDGKFKGVDCSSGVYVYLINYQFPSEQPKTAYGTVTLLR